MALVAPFASTLLSGAALLLAVAPHEVAAQASLCPTPLASQHFAYPSQIPFQVQPNAEVVRGAQSGYNICNSTTENQESMCQTSFMNYIDDFCLWAPPVANSVIADTEGEEVAWCTKPGHGTRLIPEGALTGVQFIETPDYIQIVGFIDQTKINIQAGDFGGELDPHGADLCGNPMGSLMYSNHWSGNNGTYQQVIEWTNFMGGNAFCAKACKPDGPNAAKYCEHVYDRIGCAYNAPNAAQNNVFESCKGENMDFVGVYTDASGAVQTYTQPPESLGAITTMPYTAKVPASSNCVQFQSADLYKALASVTNSAAAAASTTAASSASGSAAVASSSKAAAAGSSGTKSASAGSSTATGASSNSATSIAIGTIATFFGVVGSVLFLS